MKKKNKKAQLKRKKEFRYHKIETFRHDGKKKTIRHPAYVFLEKGNIYIYVSLTHSNELDNLLLIKLSRNPNPKDNRDSYIISEIREDTVDRFSTKIDDWSMNPTDDLMIRNLFDKK